MTLFELDEGPQGLGRDASNPIQVHDTEVSRRHAEFAYDGTHCTLTDLGSSNGTYLNGKRVEEPCCSPTATACRSAAR